MSRFERPDPGLAEAVRFPPVGRMVCDNALGVWTLPVPGVPVVSMALVIRHGTAADPAGQPGLASLTADLLDEGAGALTAIEVAEAFGRLGTELDVDVGPDATVLSLSCLSRVAPEVLARLADVVMRPRLEPKDFERIRDLRLARLRQISRSAAATADRAFTTTIFDGHPYGHGSLGTTRALESMYTEACRSFWASAYRPGDATLIITGALGDGAVLRAAVEAFGAWTAAAPPHPVPVDTATEAAGGRVLLIDRPGAPQSELRLGHRGPARHVPDYHALVVLNAIVGGQFTSRINRRLREEKGVTYGARSSFDFRRLAGVFCCDSSVQADATADAVRDVLDELVRVGVDPVGEDELAAATALLTRGYVRHFETAGQLTRGLSQLASLDLPDDTFDRFVPGVEAVTARDVQAAARAHVHADQATVVVVGDASMVASSLEHLGYEVVPMAPEF